MVLSILVVFSSKSMGEVLCGEALVLSHQKLLIQKQIGFSLASVLIRTPSLDEDWQGAVIAKNYLLNVLPKAYRSRLKMSERFIHLVGELSQTMAPQMTLFLVGEFNENGVFNPLAGVAIYLKEQDHQSLPFIEELKVLRPNLMLPEAFRKAPSIELGRVNVQKKEVGRHRSRTAFRELIKGLVEYLSEINALNENVPIWAFTDSHHIEVYLKHQITIKSLYEIELQNDGIPHHIGWVHFGAP